MQTFTIRFYESTALNSQPLTGNPEFHETTFLATYDVPDNAGETFAGSFGGVALYDYSFTLPTAFHAMAGVKYWIKIEGAQPSFPDWGLAKASGGNGSCFRYLTGLHMFQAVPGDTSFTLMGNITSTTILPDTYTLAPGAVISGTMANVAAGDNLYWVLRPGPVFSNAQDPIRLVLAGTAPGVSPSLLQFLVESKSSASGTRQTVEAYNFQSQAYDLLSQANASTGDTILVLTFSNPAQHVGPGNELRARLSYKQTTAVFAYPWVVSIDEASWRYTN